MNAYAHTTNQFVDRFAAWTDGLHLMTGAADFCEDCDRFEDGDYEPEEFSWSQCEGCGSTLGGSRHVAHAFVDDDPRKGLLHYSVCTDCLMYIANGDLPEDED